MPHADWWKVLKSVCYWSMFAASEPHWLAVSACHRNIDMKCHFKLEIINKTSINQGFRINAMSPKF